MIDWDYCCDSVSLLRRLPAFLPVTNFPLTPRCSLSYLRCAFSACYFESFNSDKMISLATENLSSLASNLPKQSADAASLPAPTPASVLAWFGVKLLVLGKDR